MKLTRCNFGHFYDKEEYTVCPYCKKLNGKSRDDGAFNPSNWKSEEELQGVGVPPRDWEYGEEKLVDLACPDWEPPVLQGLPVFRVPSLQKVATVCLTGQTCPGVNLLISLSNGQEATLGRNHNADYILNGKDLELSRVHCCIKWDSEGLYLKDMNSTNGTICGGERLSPQTYYQIQSGEIVFIGSYEYKITYTVSW